MGQSDADGCDRINEKHEFAQNELHTHNYTIAMRVHSYRIHDVREPTQCSPLSEAPASHRAKTVFTKEITY